MQQISKRVVLVSLMALLSAAPNFADPGPYVAKVDSEVFWQLDRAGEAVVVSPASELVFPWVSMGAIGEGAAGGGRVVGGTAAHRPSVGHEAPKALRGEGALIDFDSLAEGTILSDQFQDLGVVFSGTAVAEDFSDDAAFYPGATLPNYVTFGGYSPGPGSSLGCQISFSAELSDPTLTHVSFLAFAITDGEPRLLQLVARDTEGAVVDQDEFQVTATGLPLDVFSLTVSHPATASFELQAEVNTCVGIDNLRLGSSVFADGFESGDTQTWSNAVP